MALFISHASALRMLMSPRLSSLVRYARLADDDAIALESEPSAIDESVSRLCVLLGISEIELGALTLSSGAGRRGKARHGSVITAGVGPCRAAPFCELQTDYT